MRKVHTNHTNQTNQTNHTNRTTLKQTMHVPASQIPLVVKNSVLADVAALAKEVGKLCDELTAIAEKRFVMMKNKAVWYDRENVAL